MALMQAWGMKTGWVLLALLAATTTPALASHTCESDQKQANAGEPMAQFLQTDLAQSFRPGFPTLCGASVTTCVGFGTGGDVTIELWTQLPNAGGAMLASGTALAVTPGDTAEVSWCPQDVTPGALYFLVFTGTDPDMCLGGGLGNPYGGGVMFANAGYQPFPNFDYAFETFGTDCTVDQQSTVADFPIAFFVQVDLAQSFLPERSMICGASVKTSAGFGTVGDITIELWDRLPNDGGHRLAFGTATDCVPDQWVTVTWPAIGIDVTRQHFLVFESTSDIALDGSFDNYPGGISYTNPGFNPLPDFDFAFKTYADPCEIIVSQRESDLAITLIDESFETAQSFTATEQTVSGAALEIDPGGSSGELTVALYHGLPSQGGAFLAFGSDPMVDSTTGEWARFEFFPPVDLTPGEQYYLVFNALPFSGDHFFALGTLSDTYAGGQLWFDGVDTPYDLTFEVYTECGPDCYDGNVDQTGEVVLTVNGQAGSGQFWVPVTDGGNLTATIVKPSTGGNGKFVVHANWGAPTVDTQISLPGQIGTACFNMLIASGGGTGNPAAIWNNIGKTNKVGSSTYFDGTAQADPLRAPTDFLSLQFGDSANLPLGTVFTLEGVIIDPNTGANKPVSKTNAVTVFIQ